jgi:hypothetical protein
VAFGPAEELLAEQRVPRQFSDHPELDDVIRICADIAVDNEQLAALEVVTDSVEESIEHIRLDRLVALTPIDPVLGFAVGDEESVLWRPPGAAPGLGDQSS